MNKALILDFYYKIMYSLDMNQNQHPKSDMSPVFIQPPVIEDAFEDETLDINVISRPSVSARVDKVDLSPEQKDSLKKRRIARSILAGEFSVASDDTESEIEVAVPEKYQGSLSSWDKVHFKTKPQVGLEGYETIPNAHNYNLSEIGEHSTKHYAEAVETLAKLQSIVDVYGVEILDGRPINTVNGDGRERPIIRHTRRIASARKDAKQLQAKLLKLGAKKIN